MPDKLNFSPAAGFALPGHALIHARGRDARAFLQSQCMNDVNALDSGRWQYNGWLNPQGRVMALFYLAEAEPEHYLLVSPASDPGWLSDALRRFVLRSKLTLTHDATLHASADILPADAAGDAGNGSLDAAGGGYCLHLADHRSRRRLRLSSTAGRSDADAAGQWHRLDMAGGWPWLDAPLQNLWTPHMLGLQDRGALSLSKGCYPGQEIVARTHYLGKSKRRLAAVAGTGLKAGQALFQRGQEIGKVVNADGSGGIGIAVLPAALEPDPAPDNGLGPLAVDVMEIC